MVDRTADSSERKKISFKYIIASSAVFGQTLLQITS